VERPSGSNQEELRVATTIVEVPKISMPRTAAPRPVTPTGEPIDSDIKAVLEPFIDLDGITLKANSSGGNRGLRAAIKAFGCRLQWFDNESDAKAKQANEALTGKTVGNCKGFLDRHCCPPRKSCIQGIIACGMKIDEEDPAVDIFQLKKAGGSKGSGTKLVPVIPTVATDPMYYTRNVKQWLPRVLDASVAADTTNRYHACFLLCKALERMDPKAVDDVWRTTSKKKGKMDIHRQMAMTDKANVTYSQLRVI